MVSQAWLDYNNGVLWPYIAPDVATRQAIFNCPSDPDPKVCDPRLSVAGYPTPPRNFSYCLTWELDKSSWDAPLMLGFNRPWTVWHIRYACHRWSITPTTSSW